MYEPIAVIFGTQNVTNKKHMTMFVCKTIDKLFVHEYILMYVCVFVNIVSLNVLKDLI